MSEPSARGKLLNVVKSVAGAFVVCLLVLVGLKGCLVTTWGPPKQPTSYQIVGEDERSISFTFLPDKRAVVIYVDPRSNTFEAVLLKLRWGEYGTHYVGPLWNISSGAESLFGFRWVSDGAEPVRFTYDVLNKYREGLGDSSFPAVSSKQETVWYFKNGGFYFGGMWLKSVEHDPSVIDPIVATLEKK